jgi:hypothetical protein
LKLLKGKNKNKIGNYNILHQTQINYYHSKGEVEIKKKKKKKKHTKFHNLHTLPFIAFPSNIQPLPIPS